jgi:hypothetical protein
MSERAADRPAGSRATGHRLRSLDGWHRAAAIATIVVFSLLPLGAASRALAAGWTATGDVATIGIRSLDAWTGRAPLVGQPTTGEELSGIPSNHPGPIENWILGPFMRVLGPSVGMLVGIALVNGAALGGTIWLAFRRGGPNLLAIVAVMLALLVYSLGPALTFEPFNSELPTFSMIAAALAAWSVLAGDLRVLPAFAALATVAAQPHVAAASVIAPMVLVVIISLVVQWRQHPGRVRRQRAWLLAGAGVAFVGWLPPIVKELTGPSNVAALLRTQGAGEHRLGLPFMVERLATAVAPIPIWARPASSYGFMAEVSAVGVLLAALVIGGSGSLALDRRLRLGNRASSLLYLTVVASTVGALAAWAGSPPVSAYRIDSFRWPWVLSFLFWLVLAWAAWSYLPADTRRRARTGTPAVAAVAALAVGIWAFAAVDPGNLRDHKFVAPVNSLVADALPHLPPGRYHLQVEGDAATVTLGPAIALQLEDAGRPVTVDSSVFGRPYGPSRQGHRPDERGTIVVIAGADGPRPDDTVIARATVPQDDDDLEVTMVLRP